MDIRSSPRSNRQQVPLQDGSSKINSQPAPAPDGHSVTKRLQNELMTLMVSTIYSQFIKILLIHLRCQILRVYLHSQNQIQIYFNGVALLLAHRILYVSLFIFYIYLCLFIYIFFKPPLPNSIGRRRPY